MIQAGSLDQRVAFDAPTQTPDGRGGQAKGWAEVGQRWAELRYQRGQEAMQAGGLTGTASFKVRLRSDPLTRALSAGSRMRHKGVAYNVREVDAITDRASVWLVVEAGVAI